MTAGTWTRCLENHKDGQAMLLAQLLTGWQMPGALPDCFATREARRRRMPTETEQAVHVWSCLHTNLHLANKLTSLPP